MVVHTTALDKASAEVCSVAVHKMFVLGVYIII